MTPFRLLDAHSAADAVALLCANGSNAQVIAAGGDLLGLMKEGVQGPTLPVPSVLVNLTTASDLAYVAQRADGLHIGAMTTLWRLCQEPQVPPIVIEAIENIASPQLRARTTLGGNLLQRPRCLYFRHPDIGCFKKGAEDCPAVAGPPEAYPGALFPGVCHAGHPSDLAPALIALNARAQIIGPRGSRISPLVDIYRGAASNRHGEVSIARDELLTTVILPIRSCGQAFVKIAPRAANEFSWAAAAVAMEGDRDVITRACIVLGGVAPAPFIFEKGNEMLAGRPIAEIEPARVADELVPRSAAASTVTRALAARVAIERAIAHCLDHLIKVSSK